MVIITVSNKLTIIRVEISKELWSKSRNVFLRLTQVWQTELIWGCAVFLHLSQDNPSVRGNNPSNIIRPKLSIQHNPHAIPPSVHFISINPGVDWKPNRTTCRPSNIDFSPQFSHNYVFYTYWKKLWFAGCGVAIEWIWWRYEHIVQLEFLSFVITFSRKQEWLLHKGCKADLPNRV